MFGILYFDDRLIIKKFYFLYLKGIMNAPVVINAPDFQQAWLQAVAILRIHNWSLYNLVVHINNACSFDKEFNDKINSFAIDNNLLEPKHVAYTIFPQKLYTRLCNQEDLFQRYNDRFYKWTRTRPRSGWGTYFRRMLHYESDKGSVNQLANIINSINSRQKDYKAAYTVVIQKPGGETVRLRGGPCLNYIAVQIQPGERRKIGLLCVYRNHDFLERAYGNYWGLCNLLQFIAKETNSLTGPITCISSHAYVNNKKTALNDFMVSINDIS